MDFAWNEEQQLLRERVLEFARKELGEGFDAREKAGKFDRAGWDKCAGFGIHGLPIPERYGGMGCDALTTVGVLEALGLGCKDNGLLFSINAHMWTLELPILAFGTDAQKDHWLLRLCSGEIVGGNAMSEPDSGSDAYGLRTTATKKGDRWVLDGAKLFVTNGTIADVLLVFATVDRNLGPNGVSAFLVERTTPGLVVTKEVDKMGLKTSPMGELFFDGCSVPATALLGNVGSGKNIFTHSMTWERACILATAVGSMERLLHTSIRYAKERKQFGQSIGKFQLVATKIVDMKLRLESARAMLYKAAWMRDRGRSVFMEAAMAKLQISESWVQCAQDALQIHGGYGYTREYEIERELRDALGSRIYSGTSEIQRVLIGSLLGL